MLLEEWDYESNIGIDPTQVSPGSNEKVKWICKTCGYRWEAIISSRKSGRGCPECKKRSISEKSKMRTLQNGNTLALKNPTLAKFWDYEKNHPMTPDNVTPVSAIKVFWKCPSCNYSWEAMISNCRKRDKCTKCGLATKSEAPNKSTLDYFTKES